MAVLLNLIVIFAFLSSLFCKNIVFGFPPQPITGAFSTTHSHRDITHRGFYIGVATFLKDNGLIDNLHTPIADYFGSDKDKEEEFLRMIKEVTTAVNDLQISGRQTAKYSVNGEQIQAAHDFVVKTRAEMKKLARGSKTDKARKLLLEKTGHCIYVIQSFYSSTNWVEIKGSTPYYDFGSPDKTLMPVALPNTATCKSCGRSGQYAIDSCKSSLLVTNLTSGYRDGQDIHKPNLNLGTMIGKCNHGGEDDPISRTIPAVGGINKETLDYERSPRADLHNLAANAAALATSHLLIGEGGVLEDMGNDTFMWAYSLPVRKSNTSLTFIIGVSGSMLDDIKAVIEEYTQLVTDVQNTVNEAQNYVLVTFNDSEAYTHSLITNDYREMLSLFNGLHVYNGGDCPKFAMHGILRGINESNAGSELFVFTDADAKDCNRNNEVKDAALAKEMKVTFILTGTCNNTAICIRKRRSVDNDARYKRETLGVYQDISDATGGIVYNIKKTQIKDTVRKVLFETFPSSKVILHVFTHPSEKSDQMSIFVDKDVNLLKIQITGAQDVTDADITDPKGEIHAFSQATSTRIYSFDNLIMSIQNPLIGKWTLVRNTKRNWEVNLTAEANMDIGVQVIETDENGYAAEIKGNPIAGKNYSVFVVVNNVLSNITSTNITLLNKDGSDHLSLPVELATTDLGTYARIDVIVPSNEFGVQLRGLDSDGNTFMRTSGRIFSPVTIGLKLHDILDDLQTGKLQKLRYTVTNFGKNSETVQVSFTDDKNYHKNVSNQKTHNITTNQVIDDYFEITGLLDTEIVEYTISARLTGSTTNVQLLSNRIVFTSKAHPSCEIINQTGNCTVSADCSSLLWSASVQIVYSGVKLERLYLSNADTDVHISHNNYTNGTSPTNVNITGTCCSPSVYINAVDDGSYDTRCHFYFGDPYNVQLPEVPSATTSAETRTSIMESTTTKPNTSTTESTNTEPHTSTTESTTTEPSRSTTEPTTAESSKSTIETTTTEQNTSATESTTTEPSRSTTKPSTSTTESTTAEPSTSTIETATTEPNTSTTESTTTKPSTPTTESTTEPSTSTTERNTSTTESTTEPSTSTIETATTEPNTSTTESTTTKPITSTTESTTEPPSTSTFKLTTTLPSASISGTTITEPSTSATETTTEFNTSASASSTAESSTSTPKSTTKEPSTFTTETTTEPSTSTSASTTTKLSTYTSESTTTEPSTSTSESTTTEPSTSTSESTTTGPSTSTSESTTTEPSTSTSESTTTGPSTSTSESTTTEPSTPTTETTTATESSTSTSVSTTAEPSTSTSESTTTGPSTSTSESTTTEPSTPTSELTTAEPSISTSESTTTGPSTSTSESTTTGPSTSTSESTTTEPSTPTTETTTATESSTSTSVSTTTEPSTSTTKLNTAESSTSAIETAATKPSTSTTGSTTTEPSASTTESTTTEQRTSTTETTTKTSTSTTESASIKSSTSTVKSTTTEPSAFTTKSTTSEIGTSTTTTTTKPTSTSTDSIITATTGQATTFFEALSTMETTTVVDELNKQQRDEADRNMIIATTSVMALLLLFIAIGLFYSIWKIRTWRED